MAKAKTTATKPKVAPAKKSPFDVIDPLPPAQRPVPAFAADERAGQLLALGYPHMFLPTPGDFAGTDDKLRKQLDETRIVPREALARVYSLVTYPEMVPGDLAKAADEILEFAGNQYAMFALECLHGSEAIATAFVDRIEKFPAKRWKEDGDDGRAFNTNGEVAIQGLGFVLWRVPEKPRKALRARLEKVFKKIASKDPEQHYGPIAALDEILHGREGWERAHGQDDVLYTSPLTFIDDAEFVVGKFLPKLKTQSPRDRPLFDIQVAVAGGPKVLKALQGAGAKYPSHEKKTMALQLSLCT